MSADIHEYREQLRRAGCKATPPRLTVLKCFRAGHEHLSAVEVLKRGRKLYPALGRATVYRTLELLTQLGVLRPLYIGDRSPSFTLMARGHRHFVCEKCARVQEIADRGIGRLADRLARRLGGVARSHLLELYGLCGRCRTAGGKA